MYSEFELCLLIYGRNGALEGRNWETRLHEEVNKGSAQYVGG